jgi:High potential iron-sulfur protein
MSADDLPIPRRKALTRIVGVPAVAAGLAASLSARAEAKASQKAAKYQDHPKGSQKCSNCRFYIANMKDPKKNGTCQIVEGSISPNGWCALYARKSA